MGEGPPKNWGGVPKNEGGSQKCGGDPKKFGGVPEMKGRSPKFGGDPESHEEFGGRGGTPKFGVTPKLRRPRRMGEGGEPPKFGGGALKLGI